MFGLSYAKLGIGLAVLIAVGLFAFAIKAGINKIDRQGQEISTLKTDLATEKAARQKDVAGLTVLSQGVVAASSARALDDKVLSETIDAKDPKPVSPNLAAFIDGLRRQSSPTAPAAPAAGANGAARAGAGGPVHQ